MWQTLWREVYRRPRLVNALWGISYVGVALSVVGFAGLLAFFVYVRWSVAAALCLCLGGGFVLVSLWRRWQNINRPYEQFSVLSQVRKTKEGHSFPSRHAYSAFAIATASVLLHPAVFVVLFTAAVLQGASRFLLGVHFLRDVLVGALVGCLIGGGCVLACTFMCI